MPRIYLHLDVKGEAKEFNLKLPKSWNEKPITTVVEFALENYNKKNETSLGASEGYLQLGEDGEDIVLHPDGIFGVLVPNRSHLHLRIGDLPDDAIAELPKKEAVVKDPSLIPCRHFGCQKKYREVENTDDACCHHVAPPVFHETAKWWSCCPGKKGYDWDEFMTIKGCETSRHTNVKQAGPNFLGGGDVRAAAKGDAGEAVPADATTPSPAATSPPATSEAVAAPTPAPTPATAPSAAPTTSTSGTTAKDQLLAARVALKDLGVDVSLYDAARKKLAKKFDSDEKVAKELAAYINKSLSVLTGSAK